MPAAPAGLLKDRRPDIIPEELWRHAKRAKAELLLAVTVPLPAADADMATLEEEARAEAAAAQSRSAPSSAAAPNGVVGGVVGGGGGAEAAEVDEDGWRQVDQADADVADREEEEEAPINYAYLITGGNGGAAAAEEAEGAEEADAEIPEEGEGGNEVCGYWQSGKGDCHLYLDHMTNQLSFEESLGEGCGRLHGFLTKREGDGDGESQDATEQRFEAELVVLDEDQRPWYGPSFGERPEVVGEIQVLFMPGSDGAPAHLETRIKVADEDTDWQPPTRFRRRPPPTVIPEVEGSENVFVFGGR